MLNIHFAEPKEFQERGCPNQCEPARGPSLVLAHFISLLLLRYCTVPCRPLTPCFLSHTGSNSVNVFLGLGLPWVISTSYALVKGTTFRVPTGNLVQSVVVFSIVGTICIIMLLIRRKVGCQMPSVVRVLTTLSVRLSEVCLLGLYPCNLSMYFRGF